MSPLAEGPQPHHRADRGQRRHRGRVALRCWRWGPAFHPELTGRENIYLNGAILGMSKREIKAKFDEIVAFSEVEKFLDTPVEAVFVRHVRPAGVRGRGHL